MLYMGTINHGPSYGDVEPARYCLANFNGANGCGTACPRLKGPNGEAGPGPGNSHPFFYIQNTGIMYSINEILRT